MCKSTSTTRGAAASRPTPAVLRIRRVLRRAWRAVVGAVVAAGLAAVPAAAAPPPSLGLLATVTIGGHPQAVAVDPTTNTVYVAGWDAIGDGVVWALNGATGQPLYGPITIGAPPTGFVLGPDAIAVDPTTHLVYVTNSLNNSLSIVNGSDLAGPVLTVPLTGHLEAANPDVAVDAARGTVYVAASDGVEVLNGRTGQPTHAPLGAAGAPFGPLALDPSTHMIYAGGVSDSGDFVWAINENTGIATISASEAELFPTTSHSIRSHRSSTASPDTSPWSRKPATRSSRRWGLTSISRRAGSPSTPPATRSMSLTTTTESCRH
jgi:DNA-binding beta-propeller fold protein YncE